MVMAEFIAGRALTAKMKWLLRESRAAKIAVAYWGADALKLLGIDAKKPSIKVVCFLKGGKSDPDVVKVFGKRAKQHDRLHAKVIWTPNGAIVGPANASSNGMPEEDGNAASLVEAGMYETSPKELAAIEKWFDGLYATAGLPSTKRVANTG
jgi:hypothetical protein